SADFSLRGHFTRRSVRFGAREAIAKLRDSSVAFWWLTASAHFTAWPFSARGSLPASFEWPMGRADQLIEMPDGRRIAVHPASARIQVYDRDWKLLHAWVMHAGAGDFRAILLPDEKLVVWTVRG